MSKLLDEPLLVLFVLCPMGGLVLLLAPHLAWMLLIGGFSLHTLSKAAYHLSLYGAQPSIDPEKGESVGFGRRAQAALCDSVICGTMVVSIFGFNGPPMDVSYVLQAAFAVGTVTLWRLYGGTPGKWAIHARIIDARSGRSPSINQAIIRLIGYFISALPLGLGFLWSIWDPRNQTWHDKIAGTLVVYLHPLDINATRSEQSGPTSATRIEPPQTTSAGFGLRPQLQRGRRQPPFKSIGVRSIDPGNRVTRKNGGPPIV